MTNSLNLYNKLVYDSPIGVKSSFDFLFFANSDLGWNLDLEVLGEYVGAKVDVEASMHAIVDKKMDEHTVVHCSKDTREVE